MLVTVKTLTDELNALKLMLCCPIQAHIFASATSVTAQMLKMTQFAKIPSSKVT